MMEQEARTLAAELEHHPIWRVTAVYCEAPNPDMYPNQWIITLEHRDDPAKKGLLRGYVEPQELGRWLRGEFPSSWSQSS